MWTYWLQQNYQLARAYIDRARGAPKLKRRFFRTHGYRLNLDNPQTFSEKIQWRKLYDKNPIFPVLSHKYLVRQYITERLGHDRAQDLLVPLLQYTEDPDRIDFDALPSQFVLKASHGSGMNLIVEDASKLGHAATRALMRKWLLTHYRVKEHEWVYTKTRKGILAEERLAPPEQLVDVKISFFDGKMRDFLTVETKAGTKFLTFFDDDANRLDVRQVGLERNPDATPPAGLDEMVKLGEVLSGGLDFVRVDFLCTPERFYIGELTLLTGGGFAVLDPPSHHQTRGDFWILPIHKADIKASEK